MPATRSAALRVAAGMRRVALADAAERIAAQRHDVAHAGLRDRRATTASTSARVAATQVRCAAGVSAVSAEDALDRGVRALARRAAGAIGDRDEVRLQRREPRDRLPQRLLHLRGLRRKEFERDARCGAAPRAKAAGARRTVHQATSRVGAASAMRGSRASQSETAILPSGRLRRQSLRARRHRGRRPSSHCVTVSARKAEAAMRVLLAQEFEIVRREIDDQQAPAGPQHAAPPRGSRARRRRGSAAPGG